MSSTWHILARRVYLDRRLLNANCVLFVLQSSTNDPTQETDFASIVRNSILRYSTHKATCPSCNRQFATFDSRRSIATEDFPPTLALNAAVFTEDTLKFWKDGRNQQTFLKSTIELRGQVNGIDDEETVLYELRVSDKRNSRRTRRLIEWQGLIVQIVTKDKRSHLVAIIKGMDLKPHCVIIG